MAEEEQDLVAEEEATEAVVPLAPRESLSPPGTQRRTRSASRSAATMTSASSGGRPQAATRCAFVQDSLVEAILLCASILVVTNRGMRALLGSSSARWAFALPHAAPIFP